MAVQQNASEQLVEINEFVNDSMQDAKEPGLALAVVKDGEVLFSQGFGQRNVAENLAVTERTLFGIASCTKAFTAMALAMLVDEGKLAWDTPVRHYLPSFRLLDPFASERLTPRDLLIHSSGLPDYTLAWHNSPISRKELVERLQYLEPTHDLRAAWQYNNMMYATAGYLLEVLTGQSWEDFTRQRIFEPLGMTGATCFPSEVQRSSDFSLPYTDRGEYKGNVRPIEFYLREQAIGPAGAIYANLQDMTKWLQCLLNKGQYGENGQRLVSETEFSRLISPQIVEPDELFSRYKEMTLRTYAFGWSVLSYRGHTMMEHGGLTEGFCSLVTFLPESKLGIVVMTNLDTSVIHHSITYTLYDRLLALPAVPWRQRFIDLRNELIEQIAKSKQGTEAGKVPDAPPSHPLSAYTGAFSHPGFGSFSITLADGHLKGLFNDTEYTFSHHHYDVFDVYVASLNFSCKASFMSNLEGAIDSFSLTVGDPASKPPVFKRIAVASEPDKESRS